METRIDFQGFHWLDIGHPTQEILERLAQTYNLHPTSLQDCLQPEHLPKFESINDVNFIILRAYDTACKSDSDTVQELTRKVAIFYSPKFIITIHRTDQPLCLADLMEKEKGQANITVDRVVTDLIMAMVKTFQVPVMNSVSQLEGMEMLVFQAGTRKKFKLSDGYYLRRKVWVFKNLLHATLDPVNKVTASAPKALLPHLRNVREQLDNLYYYSSETLESASALLNLHISISSQKTNEASRRTNEVMRVLTIFSCFFLPINFIASIYGMNFQFMPELQWKHGYFVALGIMALVVSVIFGWFWRRGWLSDRPRNYES